MRLTCLIWGGLLLLNLTGCAGYQFGPTGGRAAGEKSVQISPFANQTMEPRLSEPVAFALRRSLQQDGTFRLESRGAGDIIVTGVITDFDRSGLSFQPNDVATVLDYRISVTAQVTARERTTGRVLLDRPVSGYTALRVGNDLNSAERQAIPLLAGDLARNITALLVDGDW